MRPGSELHCVTFVKFGFAAFASERTPGVVLITVGLTAPMTPRAKMS